jgi:hypothetical protein
MRNHIQPAPLLALSAGALLLCCAPAAAQYPVRARPTAILGAPIAVEAGPVAIVPAPPPTPAPGGPSVPFLGARYSLQGQRTPCQSFNYYGPGYVAPQFFNPRYPDPGPYFSTPTYPYVSSYYSYYFTPGFFRY